MSNIIIIDRKYKRANSDNNWDDPLSIEHAKREKARTIEIEKGDKSPLSRALLEFSPRGVVGKKAYCLKDNGDMMNGVISDIIPPCYVVIRNKGVARFSDVISIGG